MDDAVAEHLSVPAKGMPREQLKDLLLKAGWPAANVTAYLDKAYKKLDKGTILRAANVSKHYGTNQVLQNCDVDINAGEIFGIIGVSGAGKTTLLNILVGFLKPDSGDVLLAQPNGTVSVTQAQDAVKRRIGFSTQTPSFYPKLTVLENLKHFGTLYHLTEPDVTRRSNALLELVGLSYAKHVQGGNLSGGMQKRLDIACALVHDPDILVLDEPTADLDPIMRKQLWALIKQINAKGTTILLASHFLAEIELLCTRIAILQNKKILEMGTAEELRNIYTRNYEIYIKTSSQDYEPLIREIHKRKAHAIKINKEDGELVLQTPRPQEILPIISEYFQKTKGEVQLHVQRPSLGKVFEALVSK